MGSNGIAVHANGVVPADIDQNSHKCIPRDFHYDVGNDEDLPGVSLRGTLPDLVKSTLGDKMRHDLLDQVVKDCREHENGKQLVLEPLKTGCSSPEREADEESLSQISASCKSDAKNELRTDAVHRRAFEYK